MIVNGMNSALVLLSGRGFLLRNKMRNDYTELPEQIFMPGTLFCFSMPLSISDFCLYNYIGG